MLCCKIGRLARAKKLHIDCGEICSVFGNFSYENGQQAGSHHGSARAGQTW